MKELYKEPTIADKVKSEDGWRQIGKRNLMEEAIPETYG